MSAARLVEILDAIAETLEDAFGKSSSLGDDGVNVYGRWMFQAPSPPCVDVYPGDPFKSASPNSAGFQDEDGEEFFTVRARVGTADHVAAQEVLLELMDVESDYSVVVALQADQTLAGVASSVYVDGPTPFQLYEDQAGALLGCEWRVSLIRARS